MLIRNNKGDVGEMKRSVTEDGTVINTNTLYNGRRPVTQNISYPRQSRHCSLNECDRLEDSALDDVKGSTAPSVRLETDHPQDVVARPAGGNPSC